MTVSETGDVAQAAGISRETRPFRAEKAFAHVERLSYPRRVGTPEERRAARYILREFAAVGLRRRRESFSVPLIAREIGLRLVYAACACAVLQGARLGASRPLVAAACWGAAGFMVNAPWRLVGGLGRWPSASATSENLVASRPIEEEDDAPARVVFMAHYDTKSQVLPTGIRVGAVVVTTAICGLMAVSSLIAVAGARLSLQGPLPTALSAVVVALLGGLAANFTGNRSPGALDNGTGVGTLLELAQTWRPRPEAPVEVLWVATGSEETGLDGAREFLRRHEAWWREKPTLLINLDSVGAGRQIYLAGEARALGLAQETADRLELPWTRLRVLGAGMDHQPFAARGLTAVSLLGDVVGKSLVLHSARDHLGVVERPALARAGDLAGHIAWAWAEQHRPEFWGDDVPPPAERIETTLAPGAVESSETQRPDRRSSLKAASRPR
jgi:hypothetical protein